MEQSSITTQGAIPVGVEDQLRIHQEAIARAEAQLKKMPSALRAQAQRPGGLHDMLDELYRRVEDLTYLQERATASAAFPKKEEGLIARIKSGWRDFSAPRVAFEPASRTKRVKIDEFYAAQRRKKIAARIGWGVAAAYVCGVMGSVLLQPSHDVFSSKAPVAVQAVSREKFTARILPGAAPIQEARTESIVPKKVQTVAVVPASQVKVPRATETVVAAASLSSPAETLGMARKASFFPGVSAFASRFVFDHANPSASLAASREALISEMQRLADQAHRGPDMATQMASRVEKAKAEARVRVAEAKRRQLEHKAQIALQKEREAERKMRIARHELARERDQQRREPTASVAPGAATHRVASVAPVSATQGLPRVNRKAFVAECKAGGGEPVALAKAGKGLTVMTCQKGLWGNLTAGKRQAAASAPSLLQQLFGGDHAPAAPVRHGKAVTKAAAQLRWG